MKSVTTAMLVVTLLIVVGCGTLENSSKKTGQPSKPPDVSLHVAGILMQFGSTLRPVRT
jgi:hypothetical protein